LSFIKTPRWKPAQSRQFALCAIARYHQPDHIHLFLTVPPANRRCRRGENPQGDNGEKTVGPVSCASAAAASRGVRAADSGIAILFTDPAFTSKARCQCGQIGLRLKHGCTGNCGCRALGDVNAASNHTLLGERALSPRIDVNRPYVEEARHVGL
jgi:hypothetical protein